MLISELISGLNAVLAEKGDVLVCFSDQNEAKQVIETRPILYGGAAPFGPNGEFVAYLTCSDKIKELFGKDATEELKENPEL